MANTLEFTAFAHPSGRGYLVYQGKLDKPDGEPYETKMSKASLKFLAKRGATIHWVEEWSL